MRCCSKSTTWRGKALAGAAVGLLLLPPAVAVAKQPALAGESAVRHAVVQAVRLRMGQDADVHIEALEFKATPAPEGAILAATPESGARLGRQNRFSLQWLRPAGDRRPAVAGGYALAKVFVSVTHVCATRDLSRGETCAEADVMVRDGEVGSVLVQKLPGLQDVVGTRVLRPIAADDVMTASAVQVRPTVASGDVVSVRVSVAGVSVQGQAVAQQSGSEGDVIRVLNRESRRALKARVVGPGQVEVVQ